MASAGLREELECSICLNLYTDPVTLRCGHNFCRVCIDQVLNTQDGSGVYSCPECRGEFQDRPALQKNITLCNVVENFRSTHQDEAVIFCTYCVDSPVPAVRSCLMCEASLCDKHLKVHSKGPEHVLTEPRTSLENRKCPIHKKILEYYCTEDNACICVSCSLAGEHGGHPVKMLDEASEEKKKKLRNVLQKLITKREKTEERVQSLEERRRKGQEKSSGEAERVTALFIDIRRRLDDLEKRILSEISRQEEKMSLSLSDVIQKLEIKKNELSRKMMDIEELCNMTDPLTVLLDPDTGDLCDPEEEGSDEDTDDLCDLEEEVCNKDTWRPGKCDQSLKLKSHISRKLSDIIRDVTFYVQDPTDILLDVNSAGNKILISDMKTATWTDTEQNRPETAVRFLDYSQVMSGRRFSSGQHYWDVEISGTGIWRVGMCYPSIDRSGYQSLIGDNNKSWVLCGGQRCNMEYSVIHSDEVILLPHQISSDRFRICLDYEAGQLSFYELCDPIRHLHTFTTTFTEPLHAALYVYKGSIKISGGGAAVRNHHHRGNLPRDW
ncbi:E3 ubiquitin/ISG15 ligase TRIM25-like [Hyla sarda]|uniref:E3 ubiquitin/ISG15 ligase TRIM25-like n=1 Tax=Hyla sarda TaxID=327740 RepID=UPI0024C2C6DC|nr:E3 ubiquitin/ISG15 ligase TRIM25-like [Hyla sarda]